MVDVGEGDRRELPSYDLTTSRQLEAGITTSAVGPTIAARAHNAPFPQCCLAARSPAHGVPQNYLQGGISRRRCAVCQPPHSSLL